MNVPKEHEQEFERFPAALRDLVLAELAAGNAIAEITSGFPAPPVGACLKLAGMVITRPRESNESLQFYERNHPGYSGEFTDAKRFFFVLEPPRPPEPEPEMDARRAEREARERSADAELLAGVELKAKQHRTRSKRPSRAPVKSRSKRAGLTASPLLDRFRASMVMNYERWHDGVGYDLELLESATAEEREQIEHILLAGGVKDWRDVQALAALGTSGARRALRAAFGQRDNALRVALLSHAPTLFNERQRTAVLVQALENAGDDDDGLVQALLLVEDYHPASVVEALLRGVLGRDGATAGEFAAMLLFIHGKADSPYDMEERAFLLRFQESDRQTPFRELCDRIGVDEKTRRRLMGGVRRRALRS